MVEHTPSYKIAASLLPHESNGLCFVGYCDPDTPGGKLLSERSNESFFFDALDYLSPLNASIDQFDLSGHAERNQLAEYAEQSQARAVVLTHGDPDARAWFEDNLTKKMPGSSILNPKPLAEYTI